MSTDDRPVRQLLVIACALVALASSLVVADQQPVVAPVATAPLAVAGSPVDTPLPKAPAPRARAVPATRVVQLGDGVLTRVAPGPRRGGDGPVRRYTVAVEGGLGIEPEAFARAVERVLGDARSWGAGSGAFQRVTSGPVAFRVALASPRTTDRLCRPLQTNGRYSCGTGSLAVVNSMRWLTGAPAYAGRLLDYRAYVVNHEVGHTLGHGHVGCPGAGRPAPVMLQQTKGVGACRAQPWPFP